MNSYQCNRHSLQWAVAVILLCSSANSFAGSRSASLAVNPTSIGFGSVAVNSSTTQNIVMLNTGTFNVTVASATTNGASFTVTGLALPMTLSPGQSAAFQVKFTPSTLSSVTGTLNLKKNNGTVLASVQLSGTGSDGIAPLVTVTAPGNGATISASVALTSNASDNMGVAGVQFFVNGTAIGQEVTVAPYSVSWDTTKVSNGSGYVITAQARDTAGNRTTSAGISVAVSNVAPVQHSAALSWGPSASSVVGYHVYRATQTGGPYARVTTSPYPSTLFTDSSVSGGQVYYYVVTAVDGNQVESAFSNESVAAIPF